MAGGVRPKTDVDRYTVRNEGASAISVNVRTRAGERPNDPCTPDFDTFLQVNVAGEPAPFVNDDRDVGDTCSELTVNLAPGGEAEVIVAAGTGENIVRAYILSIDFFP